MARKLSIGVQGEREILMRRVFDAPRRRLFDAWTRPKLLQRWLGVRHGWTMPVCEIDLRVGGAYRFVWRRPDGAELGARGVYREIVAPERLVNTELFDEAWYPGEALITHTFEERSGETTATATVRYESAAARDAVLGSAMEGGVSESYDKLAELLRASG